MTTPDVAWKVENHEQRIKQLEARNDPARPLSHTPPATHLHDAADVGYTPAVLVDWTGGVDPGAVSDALDQLAQRVTDDETALTTHAGAADPHTGYVREADANWIALTDGGVTALHSHAGGSGHTIRENGADLTARTGLNFVDASAGAGLIVDDAGNDETEVHLDLYLLASGGRALTGTWAAGQTITATQLQVINQGELRLLELTANGSSYIAHRANASRTTDIRYTWPATDPSAGQVLGASSVSGSGPVDVVLAWQAAGSGTSLDGAYDFGGAGAGRTITADAGAVTINAGAAVTSTTTIFDVHGHTKITARHLGSDDASRSALEVSGYMSIVGTNPDDGNIADLVIATNTVTLNNIVQTDAKTFWGQLLLGVTTGLDSDFPHAASAGAVAISADGSIDYTDFPSGGRFTASIGGNQTISGMAAVKALLAGQSGIGSGTGTLTLGYIYLARDVDQIGTNTVVSQVAFGHENLSGATNNWGAQWGTANKGSYINHKLKLGAASEATAGYILDAVGNSTFTGTMEISSTLDVSGNTSVKGGNELRLYDSASAEYTALKAAAAASLTANQILVMPFDAPSAGEVLKIASVSGTGPYTINLEWATDLTGAGGLPITSNTQLASNASWLYADVASSGIHLKDNIELQFGTGTATGAGDAKIYFSGSHLIIDPDVVTTTAGLQVSGHVAMGTATPSASQDVLTIAETYAGNDVNAYGINAHITWDPDFDAVFGVSATIFRFEVEFTGTHTAAFAQAIQDSHLTHNSTADMLGGSVFRANVTLSSSGGVAGTGAVVAGYTTQSTVSSTGRVETGAIGFNSQDFSNLAQSGTSIYGFAQWVMDHANGASAFRYPFYYGDIDSDGAATNKYWFLQDGSSGGTDQIFFEQRVNEATPAGNAGTSMVRSWMRNHTLGNSIWFRDENGRDSAPAFRMRYMAPMPLSGTNTSAAGVLLANTSTGYVGLVNLSAPISVKQIRMRLTAIASGGTPAVRIAVYDERGQNKLIDVVTTAALTGGVARNIDTAVSPSVVLPPGNYYICIGLSTAAATTQPTIAMWSDNITQSVFEDGGGSEPDLVGTIAFTAGAAPTTFDPTSAITVTASRCPLLAFQGDAL